MTLSSAPPELRWFVPGRGPTLAGVRPRHRIDRYHLGSLSPDSAVKARGRRARIEVKVLLGREDPVEVAGAWWCPERWVKSAGFDWPAPEAGDWVPVEKRIWRADGVEVCHLSLAGASWWSLALKVQNATIGSLAAEVADHLRASADDRVCCAYPEWLLSQVPISGASQRERV